MARSATTDSSGFYTITNLPVGTYDVAVYRTMIGLATSFDNSPVGNNATFQQPNPFDFREEIIRLDYRFNEKHNIYGRYMHDNNNLIDPFGTFINSQLPTIPSNRLRPGTSIQIGYTWLITPTFINEAKANASWVDQQIQPASDFWKREIYGFAYQQLFSGGGRFENSIPDTTITGFASFNGAARSLVSPTTDIMVSDNVTWVRGSHTLKSGALVYRNRIDQNGRTTYAGLLAFNNSGNPNTSNNAFADALLGNFRTYSEAAIDPLGFFRFTQFEAFVNDSWKVNNRLSLELGVRYQFGTPIYTQANNVTNFDPRLYNPAQAVTVLNNGTIDTSQGGNRFNGLIRAGSGVPPEELGRVPGGDSAAVLAVPTGAPRGLYEGKHYFMPRVGFAFTPFSDNKTAIRGGVGMYYDRIEGNLIFPSIGNLPFNSSAQFENANLSNITSGSTTVTPFADIFAIDPELDTPYTISYSLTAWINRSAFAAPPDTRRGTSGAGIIAGPGSQAWDFSARKRIPLTERLRLQLQADIFNTFNRANFRTLETNLANAGFGRLTAAGPARNIQVGVKLTF